jgi:hypothetical protein
MITPFLLPFWFCPCLVEGGWMADLLHYFYRSRSLSRLPHVSFPFLRFLLPAAVALIFSSPTLRPDSHCWLPLACGGGGWVVGSRLHCHPTRHQGSVMQNRASSLLLTSAGQWQKSLAMTGCEFCLAAPSDQNERSRLGGTESGRRGQDGLPREVLPSEPSK